MLYDEIQNCEKAVEQCVNIQTKKSICLELHKGLLFFLCYPFCNSVTLHQAKKAARIFLLVR